MKRRQKRGACIGQSKEQEAVDALDIATDTIFGGKTENRMESIMWAVFWVGVAVYLIEVFIGNDPAIRYLKNYDPVNAVTSLFVDGKKGSTTVTGDIACMDRYVPLNIGGSVACADGALKPDAAKKFMLPATDGGGYSRGGMSLHRSPWSFVKHGVLLGHLYSSVMNLYCTVMPCDEKKKTAA